MGRAAILGLLSAVLVCAASCRPPDRVHPVDFSVSLNRQLEPLAAAIGDSRIILLGENGHGVGSITQAKVEVVSYLAGEMGFEVLIFESGLFECGNAGRQTDLSARDRLYACLRYPFQHAEVMPLFSRHDAAGTPATEGMDIQAQGFDSEPRPLFSKRVLASRDPVLAGRVSALDSLLYLMEAQGGLGDSIYSWAATHGDSARALYRRASELTSGWERWVFRMGEGWLARLEQRGRAEAEGVQVPARYYELRDEWMARAVSAHADSLDGPQKVVVWLHNDHARYGEFMSAGGPARSVGGYLRERYGDDVFSVGFFMGAGQIADNGRDVRTVDSLPRGGIEQFLGLKDSPASYVVLRGAGAPVAEWAAMERPYLRMGTDLQSMVPAEEFDALFFVGTATVPEYSIPEGGQPFRPVQTSPWEMEGGHD
jgi:erythromycin esterase